MPSLAEIADAARVSNVRITPHAALLIKNVLEAISEDPHPRWRSSTTGEAPNSATLRDFQQYVARDLPRLLEGMQKEEETGDREVTSFDLLHWLSKYLDSLCPFEKW